MDRGHRNNHSVVRSLPSRAVIGVMVKSSGAEMISLWGSETESGEYKSCICVRIYGFLGLILSLARTGALTPRWEVTRTCDASLQVFECDGCFSDRFILIMLTGGSSTH